MTDVVGQLIENKGDFSKVDWTKVGISTAVGISTRNMGVLGTTITNTAVEAGNLLIRENAPLADIPMKTAITAITTATGGAIGKKFEAIMNKKYNPTYKKYEFETVYIPYPVEIQKPYSVKPSIAGNIADNLSSGSFKVYLDSVIEKLKNEK